MKPRADRRQTGSTIPPGSSGRGGSFLPLIAASGFAAAVAQIILLRELMVLCYGIELCMGLILAAWITGSAAGCVGSLSPRLRLLHRRELPGLLLVASALVLPLTLAGIRTAGLFTGAAAGELPPLSRLLPVCIGVPLPFSVLSGALFALCWKAVKREGGIPLPVYIGEALGATAGGIFFYLLVACRQSALTVLLFTSLGLMLTAAWFFRRHFRTRRALPALVCLCTGMIIAALALRAPIDLATRRIQWGTDFIAARDTPYQNLAMLRNADQLSIFSNGLWLFSAPDPLSREWSVHPALLMHPAPASVLLLGGDQGGLSAEVLRHPSVIQVDVVALDPAMTAFSAPLSAGADPPDSAAPGTVVIHYGDAASYIRNSARSWDVIVMNVGDPVNAQMNRFYTAAFFSAVREHLTPGGIFSFGVSGSQEMLGEVQISFLGAMRQTLAGAFPEVSVLPGDPVRFFATGPGGALADDPRHLIDRLRQRGLRLSHVREDTLRDRFETFRRQYFDSVLGEAPADRINRDFSPLCYVHALGLWSAQWHSRLGDIVTAMGRIRLPAVWGVLLPALGLTVLFFRDRRRTPRAVVELSVGTVGAITMGIQMALLIVFQLLCGALFLHLALIVALFMAGLAVGAGWVSARQPAGAGQLLRRIQAWLSLFPLLLAGVFLLLHASPSWPGTWGMPAVFAGLSLISGILGGAHFGAATQTLAGPGVPASGIGGRLYGVDLAGAAVCLVAATFLVIPALGPVQLMPILSAAGVAGLLPLLGRT